MLKTVVLFNVIVETVIHFFSGFLMNRKFMSSISGFIAITITYDKLNEFVLYKFDTCTE